MVIEPNHIYNMDCREGLKLLPEETIDCVITSPPYYGLRDYGLGENELGSESTPKLYIKHLCDIFDQVWRILKKTGTVWVNIGDTYNGTGGGHKFKENRESYKKYNPNLNYHNKPKNLDNIPRKSLIGIPERFVIEMTNRGWIRRNTNIWHKPNCMPESAKDRFTRDFEYIYFFTKNQKYWFNQLKEPVQESTKIRIQYPHHKKTAKAQAGMYSYDPDYNYNLKMSVEGRNKRTTWTISTKPNPVAHFATYPPELVEIMVKAGCPKYVCKKCGFPREKVYEIVQHESYQNYKGEGTKPYEEAGVQNPSDVKRRILKSMGKERVFERYTDCGCGVGFEGGIVLDPFAGSGTTLYTAWNLGRRYIGFELSAEYCKIAEKEIEKKCDIFERNKHIKKTQKIDFKKWL